MNIFGLLAVVPLLIIFMLKIDSFSSYEVIIKSNLRVFIKGTLALFLLNLIGRIIFLLNTGDIEFSPYLNYQIFFISVIYAPIVEEVMFRWGIIDGLRGLVDKYTKKQLPIWVYIIIAAVIFGMLHSFDVVARSLDVILMITYGGIIYGVGYVKYGLVSAILLHASTNIFVILF